MPLSPPCPQARITALHLLLEPQAPLNQWMKRPPGLPGLAGVDPNLVVTPPAGLEAGYVPVALYEGLVQPGGCGSSS